MKASGKTKAMLAGAILGAIALLSMGQTNLHKYNAAEALNKLLGVPIHEYTLDEAMNVFAARKTKRDSLVGLFSIVWDDGKKSVWDSISTMDKYGFAGTVTIIPNNTLHGDTVTPSGALSISNIRNLRRRGWTFGNHGYYSTIGLYGYPDGLLGTGTYSSMDTFIWDIEHGHKAINDTLGIPTRYWSSPNNSTWWRMEREIAKWEEFGLAPIAPASGGSSSGRRGNVDYAVKTYVYGSGTGQVEVTATPGRVSDPYQIAQVVNEQMGLTEVQNYIKRAMQVKGWAVFIGHGPDAWASHLGGQGFSGLLSWLNQQVQSGKLRVVTLDEGYDLMYRTPIGEAANFIEPNFDDIDGDGKIDNMYTQTNIGNYRDSTRANNAAKPGYADYGYITLDWTGLGKESGTFTSYTNDEPWETRNCEWLVFQPTGAGRTVRFEAMVQIDKDLYPTYTSGDSIGVVFTSGWDAQWNRWGSSPLERFTPNNNQQNAAFSSSALSNGTNIPGNIYIVHAPDTVGGAWISVQANWRLPERGDVVHVQLWKGARVPAGAVRVSNVFIGFTPSNPQQKW